MREKLFETPSGILHYWVNESCDDFCPWLVFLPGLTADHRLFDAQIAFFEGRVNLLVWDGPAHGASRPFKLDFTMDSLADLLHQVLEKEGIEKPVLVGQSLGGYIAQAFMDCFPGETGGFVSIDSAPLQRRYMTTAEIFMLKHTKLMYLSIPWKLLIWWGARGTARTEEGRQCMEAMMRSFGKREYCSLAAYGFRMLAQAVELNRKYEIDCPALLLCGEHDGAGSARRYNVRWHEVTGLPFDWVPDAGHNSNSDNPAFVNARIDGFLEGIDVE